MALDSAGNLYVPEAQRIRRVSPQGDVTTLAGKGGAVWLDGDGTAAGFYFPSGLGIDSRSEFAYVGDFGSHRIRKVSLAPPFTVTTVAGDGESRYLDGAASSASFKSILYVAVDRSDNVFISDEDNHAVRVLGADGTVSTLAGSGPTSPCGGTNFCGSPGFADGAGTDARFNRPSGLAVDSLGFVYVADSANHRVRKISPAGLVSTLAGSGGAGFLDAVGLSAQFNIPRGVAVDRDGTVFVVEWTGQRVRAIFQNPAAECGDAVWRHVALVHGGAANASATLYVDGAPASFLEQAAFAVPADGAAALRVGWAGALAEAAAPQAAARFQGAVSDVQIFARALGADEVSALAQLAPVRPTPSARPSATASPSASPTTTPSGSPTETPTPSATPSESPSATPSASFTPLPPLGEADARVAQAAAAAANRTVGVAVGASVAAAGLVLAGAVVYARAQRARRQPGADGAAARARRRRELAEDGFTVTVLGRGRGRGADAGAGARTAIAGVGEGRGHWVVAS